MSGFGTVVDLSGCSFALGKNDVCDALLCKFRCPKHLEPDVEAKIGLHTVSKFDPASTSLYIREPIEIELVPLEFTFHDIPIVDR